MIASGRDRRAGGTIVQRFPCIFGSWVTAVLKLLVIRQLVLLVTGVSNSYSKTLLRTLSDYCSNYISKT